jgi:hypothetical protein
MQQNMLLISTAQFSCRSLEFRTAIAVAVGGSRGSSHNRRNLGWPEEQANGRTQGRGGNLGSSVSMGAFAFTVFKGRYDQITGVKPALVFVYDHDSGWQIQNIGAGPALIIVVAKKEGGKNSPAGTWIEPVRIPPLKKDGAFSLHWDPHNNTHGLGATYEDMWARSYTTMCARDLNVIRRGLRLRTWDEHEINAEWAVRKS